MSELLVLLALVLLVVLALNIVQKTFSFLGLVVLGLLLAGLFRWFTSGTPLPADIINATGLSNWIKLPKPTVVASPSSNPTTPATQALLATSNTTGGYRVTCPNGFQVLNVRNAPGLTTRVAAIPCGSTGVKITGSTAIQDNETWVPIRYQSVPNPPVQGWVARRLLTP
jgi:hypothetical protein